MLINTYSTSCGDHRNALHILMKCGKVSISTECIAILQMTQLFTKLCGLGKTQEEIVMRKAGSYERELKAIVDKGLNNDSLKKLG